MKYLKLPLVVVLSVCISGLLAIVSAHAASIHSGQGQSTALERGYRTGYSDGYTAGYKDTSIKAPRAYQNKEDYQRADRSFNEAWGTIEDYRDGYQQGFEAGYSAGYEQQQFDSSLPAGFRRRGAVATNGVDVNVNTSTTTPANTNPDDNADLKVTPIGSISIPRNTVLALELITPVSTDA